MILTTAIIKGGAGKSTTAAALLQAAARCGEKALGVDIGPQANLTLFLAADQNRPGAIDLLHGAAAADLIQHTPQGIDVIAGAPDLAAEVTRAGSGRRLETALKPVNEEYDLIIIDTPPQTGELLFNALQAAEGVLIPLEADSAHIQGFYQIADIAHQMQHSNPKLEILGSVVIRYDSRPGVNRALLEKVRSIGDEIGAPLLQCIRQDCKIREAQGFRLSLYEYKPRCKAAADYMELYRTITEKRG